MGSVLFLSVHGAGGGLVDADDERGDAQQDHGVEQQFMQVGSQ